MDEERHAQQLHLTKRRGIIEERRKQATAQKMTKFDYTCPTCGVVVHQATMRQGRAAPTTVSTLIKQAFRDHKQKTGCSGDPPPPAEPMLDPSPLFDGRAEKALTESPIPNLPDVLKRES